MDPPTDKQSSSSLRLKAVLERVPVSKSTWWAGVKSGRYPRPIRLGPRITAWREQDILNLIKNGFRNDNDGEGKTSS